MMPNVEETVRLLQVKCPTAQIEINRVLLQQKERHFAEVCDDALVRCIVLVYYDLSLVEIGGTS